MIQKEITYTDFNGVERTETYYFNLSKSELTVMEAGTEGGYGAMIRRIVASKNNKEIIDVFQSLILKAYGEKSADGRRFIKSPELSEAFSQTPAYDSLFMELATNADAAAAFVNGLMPADLAEKVREQGALEKKN